MGRIAHGIEDIGATRRDSSRSLRSSLKHSLQSPPQSLKEAAADSSARGNAQERRAEVHRLRSRILLAQDASLGSRVLETFPGLGRLLPGGGVQHGGSYAALNSTALAMALAAGPSAAGLWCAVIGVPGFGVEAAAQRGISLDRLVLVPSPGDQWLSVTAALVDVMGLVLVHAPERATEQQTSRLMARLRQRHTVLVSLGAWPAVDATLRVTENRWEGLGAGYGQLSGRSIQVESRWRNGRSLRGQLRLDGSPSPGRTTHIRSVPELSAQDLPARDLFDQSPMAQDLMEQQAVGS
ncbi:hypothetical protein [Psychromicrobium xiongbiense]|uniref:hypothetical protein n=1 Tax=Psychromicrobium xiongbiense TaxID=3051184 RepID=UPI002554A35F|nr:hypothetical protein [Psychromicrobium sp. YIM S02556]